MRPTITMTLKEWRAMAVHLFGPDEMSWRFRCPCCSHECSVRDYKDAGAPISSVGFSCIGRWLETRRQAFDLGPGPCNYAGGGLFQLNPVNVEGERTVFEFGAPVDPKETEELS